MTKRSVMSDYLSLPSQPTIHRLTQTDGLRAECNSEGHYHDVKGASGGKDGGNKKEEEDEGNDNIMFMIPDT